MLEISDEFPITQSHHYLNTASQGPWPARTATAVQQLAARAQIPGTDRSQSGSAIVNEARERLARLLNVQPVDLVFGPNTTYGLNVCMHGIDWREGDNLVVPEREFPSVQYSLAHLPKQGVAVRRVAWQGCGSTVEQIMACVDARTRAVVCSAIAWDTGYRMDIEALGARCAKAGCLLIVDGIHAVGAEAIDLKALRVSAFTFHGYKWLMAGFGLGALYVAPDALNHIQPMFIGPLGVAADVMGVQDPPQWREGAQRFATGNDNVTGAAALNASLTLIEEMGIERIQAHNYALADTLAEGLRRHLPNGHVLRSNEPQHQSAIVVFSIGDPQADVALVDRLAARNIIVAQRPQGIRVSPHLFNTAEDIESLLAAL
jgi:cysteine desulfurase / selenocysteine lyase